ncbi:hypothetical protein Leryth_026848 [Lithospermum erythrorhizon]|nr:hypothetical protein Leryth_026848 [Lithospermum erythrorhizon]
MWSQYSSNWFAFREQVVVSNLSLRCDCGRSTIYKLDIHYGVLSVHEVWESVRMLQKRMQFSPWYLQYGIGSIGCCWNCYFLQFSIPLLFTTEDHQFSLERRNSYR